MFPKSVKNLATVKTIQFIHSNHLQGSRDYFFKGQSNEIFDPQYFSSFEPAWATDQWVKYFRIWFSFHRKNSKLSIKNTDSAQYHTALSLNKI